MSAAPPLYGWRTRDERRAWGRDEGPTRKRNPRAFATFLSKKVEKFGTSTVARGFRLTSKHWRTPHEKASHSLPDFRCRCMQSGICTDSRAGRPQRTRGEFVYRQPRKQTDAQGKLARLQIDGA